MHGRPWPLFHALLLLPAVNGRWLSTVLDERGAHSNWHWSVEVWCSM